MSEWDIQEQVLTPVDRSELEAWATCPQQAAQLASGKILNASPEMDSGNAVHEAFSRVTQEYIDSQSASEGNSFGLNMDDLRNSLDAWILTARPDIQQDAIEGMRASAWSWCKFIKSIQSSEILRFDGGEGKRSGQIGYEFPDLGLVATSELDFLFAGPSPEVVHLIDYKTGNQHWTAQMVKESFQFQMHGLLVLTEFPEVRAVEVRVWNTRINNLTYSVTFDRDKDYNRLLYRVRAACETKARYSKAEISKVEAWPGLEKCSGCRAAALCAASKHVGDAAASPETALLDLIALQAKVDAQTEILKGIVKAQGRDIVLASGESFGFEKPKQVRKLAAIYSTKKSSGEEAA